MRVLRQLPFCRLVTCTSCDSPDLQTIGGTRGGGEEDDDDTEVTLQRNPNPRRATQKANMRCKRR